MANPNDIDKSDKDEGADDRRDSAERTWQDRAGIPRGTPEQGQRSADRVGGSGSNQPEPEVQDEDVGRQAGGGSGDVENQEEKRQAAAEQHKDDRSTGQGTAPKNG